MGAVEPKDVAAVGGFALLLAGLGMIYLPLAVLFAGLMLLAAGLWQHFQGKE